MKNIKKGSFVSIDLSAVADSNLKDSKGIVLDLWDEPLKNSKPTPLAKILLKNGDLCVVGQHEIKNLIN